MVFSDTSGLGGIVEDIDFLCGTDATSYPLKDKARNANRHLYKAVIDIIKTGGRFQFDDSNLTTQPVLAFDLVSGQKDYSWPAGVLKISAIEIKDSSGNWIRLKEIDTDDLRASITDFEKTSGMPRYYDIQGDSILFYPTPATGSVTTTAGGKLWTQRELDTFTSVDTTQEPGIAEPFHRLCSLGPAYDWLVVNDTQTKTSAVLQQYEQLRMEMREFYSTKNKDSRVMLKPAHSILNYL